MGKVKKLPGTMELSRMIEYLLKSHVILEEKYPSKLINDIKSYPLQIIKRLLKECDTLQTVITDLRDLHVSLIILRTLADSISTLRLVYLTSEEEERTLRHYLYVMDGTYERVKFLEEKLKMLRSQSQSEYVSNYAKIEYAQKNYKDSIEFCKQEIRNLELYNKERQAIDTLIDNCNWKYKQIRGPKNEKNKQSWNSIYKNLDISETDIFTVFSESVHGLSTSNMCLYIEEDEYESIYCIAYCLVYNIYQFINEYYKDDLSDKHVMRRLANFIVSNYCQ